jgi:glutamate racemase
VLATPGTVARDYTRELIETYAASRVTLGRRDAPRRPRRAGAEGEAVDDAVLAAEIAPASSRLDGRRTDVVTSPHALSPAAGADEAARALAGRMDRSGPAIARRVAVSVRRPLASRQATASSPTARLSGPLRIALAGYGLAQVVVEPMPLAN